MAGVVIVYECLLNKSHPTLEFGTPRVVSPYCCGLAMVAVARQIEESFKTAGPSPFPRLGNFSGPPPQN